MQALESRGILCPHCWSEFETLVDHSAGPQDCYEDCPVCCNAVRLRTVSDGDDLRLEVLREDD